MAVLMLCCPAAPCMALNLQQIYLRQSHFSVLFLRVHIPFASKLFILCTAPRWTKHENLECDLLLDRASFRYKELVFSNDFLIRCQR